MKEAYEILGPERVRELNYHQSNIKREMIKLEHETLDTKIYLLLDALLPKQVAIPKTEITSQLDIVYKGLNLKKKAKATDIKSWYDVKETTKRGSDGKTHACFCILSSRIKIGK